jgi:hypothetical protein
MKQYRLKRATPKFIDFLHKKGVKYDLLGGMEINVYAYRDQDIFELGKSWQKEQDKLKKSK